MWKSFTSEIKALPYKRAILLTMFITLGVVLISTPQNNNIFEYILEPFKIENIEKARIENAKESNASTMEQSSKIITQAEAESMNIEDVIEEYTPIDVNSFFHSNMTEQEARIAYRDAINSIQDWYDDENRTVSGGFINSVEIRNVYNDMLENAKTIYNSYLE